MSLSSKTRFIARNTLRPILGWEKWNELQFRFVHGYKPNFKNPSTFLEYLQFLKYCGGAGELAPFIDKFAVKDFVRNRVGASYVVPTERLLYPNEDIDLSGLPDRWIAKSVHAAGWNHLHDSGPIDQKKIRRKIRRWLRRNYFSVSGETNYCYIPPKVMFEPLISEVGEDLMDYKIWCFAGEPMLIGVHGNRKAIAKGQIFTLSWERSRWVYPGIPAWDEMPKRPRDLETLLGIARSLSRDFPFVRVDLYNGLRGVFFGELTFTPGDGSNIRIPPAEDLCFGQKIVAKSALRRIDAAYSIELHH